MHACMITIPMRSHACTCVHQAPPTPEQEKEAEDLRKNFDAFVDAIVKAKPSGSKGKYVRKIALSSSMGPGVKVDVAEVASI